MLEKIQEEVMDKVAAEEAKVGPLPRGWRWDWTTRMEGAAMVWSGRPIRIVTASCGCGCGG